MLCNNHDIGLNDWYARPTLCGRVNNGIYMTVRPRYVNMNSSEQPNIYNHANVAISMVKGFQQQALLSKTFLSMPVFSGEKNLFDPWVTAVENAAKLSHQDPIDVAMMKLTGPPLHLATCL